MSELCAGPSILAALNTPLQCEGQENGSSKRNVSVSEHGNRSEVKIFFFSMKIIIYGS
jgi:hypothetical protein